MPRAFGMLLVILAMLLGRNGSAAAATVSGGEECEANLCAFNVQISGRITEDAARDFVRVAGRADQIINLKVNSDGGSVRGAMALGRELRTKTVNIIVAEDARCVSACVLLLAGASMRDIAGAVGIHRPYFEVPTGALTVAGVQAASDKVAEEMRAYFRGMNVSAQIVDDMLLIPPERVRWLTAAELRQYGIADEDPVYREATILVNAQRYGLTRQQYLRRTARADAECRLPDPVAMVNCYEATLRGQR
ncbi:ATP-dependent Clp protease proteolytic subunit [Azospirillum sp. TSO22-1]|uniref:ATP-dependent Clp protease proteolytic subunit n=1 Tax=Azospirillum sp. TSO22-1 TaxID=716789 RepID=UPI000D620665|nr:ATP-dependent Clp protease proteolytic subunit [Azospirillum sp. TSO22-1]PWC53620.1 hypothetical protein TSO221_10350 [Azospirillum sp. TSO22-1]